MAEFLISEDSAINGGTFCVFDPHCKYVPKAEIDAPGLQINNLLTLENNYSDVYGTYLQRELSSMELMYSCPDFNNFSCCLTLSVKLSTSVSYSGDTLSVVLEVSDNSFPFP
jgi:hypothetical protein